VIRDVKINLIVIFWVWRYATHSLVAVCTAWGSYVPSDECWRL